MIYIYPILYFSLQPFSDAKAWRIYSNKKYKRKKHCTIALTSKGIYKNIQIFIHIMNTRNMFFKKLC